GMTPVLRLLGAVVVVVGLVLAFAFLVRSCGTSKKDSYSSYMAQVSKIAAQSTQNGSAVANALATPGLKVTDIETKLDGIATQEGQNVKAAQALHPPGRLRNENAHLIEALQFRVSGTAGLAATFAPAAASKD